MMAGRRSEVVDLMLFAAMAFAAFAAQRYLQADEHPASTSPQIGPAQAPPPPSAFTRELTREANLSGFNTRAAMAAHMRKYVENNWEPQPDPETIRRRLKEWFYYDDLPD